MKRPFTVTALVLLAAVCWLDVGSREVAGAQTVRPLPVRNDVAKQAGELLVLRNHRLRSGGHQRFYELSRDGLWPYFERIGARVVGQWKRISPPPSTSGEEDVYRLVRYAGFEHWQATRSGNYSLGGNGPAAEAGDRGIADRKGLELGSQGAYFMTGRTATVQPRFMPGLPEQFERISEGERPDTGAQDIPVRVGVAQPSAEIVELRHQRIRKGSFGRFVTLTESSIWPWEEKLGARPIGQWQLVYPAPVDGRPGGVVYLSNDSPDYDQVITITRFASARHREAMHTDRAVLEGGNGPDYHAWRAALNEQRALILETSVELLEGMLYESPPKFLPAISETYRRVK